MKRALQAEEVEGRPTKRTMFLRDGRQGCRVYDADGKVIDGMRSPTGP
jgi:hypothetical protein